MNSPEGAKGGASPRGRFNAPRLAGAFEWESLGLLRDIVALRVGYYGVIAVPILAYVILQWNRVAPAVLPSMPPLELPKTLFFVFLGSALLALGHLLNEVACPKLIKLHGTLHRYQSFLAEFVANEDAIFRAAETAEQLIAQAELRAKLPTGDSPELDEITKKLAAAIAKSVVQAQQMPDGSEPLITHHRHAWETANKQMLAVRIVIVVCYGLAAAVAAGLAVVQLGRVLCATFGSQTACDYAVCGVLDLCH